MMQGGGVATTAAAVACIFENELTWKLYHTTSVSIYFGCEESHKWSGFLETSPISQKQ